jgi:hypothetical protein
MFSFFVEHVLGDLPLWLWPFVAGAGFGCYFLAGVGLHFPNTKPYATVDRPVCLIVFILGVFMYGGAGVAAVYKQSIEEEREQRAVLAQASSDATTAVDDKTQAGEKAIHDTQIVYRDRIKEVAKIVNSECILDQRAISVLNDAAKNPVGASK